MGAAFSRSSTLFNCQISLIRTQKDQPELARPTWIAKNLRPSQKRTKKIRSPRPERNSRVHPLNSRARARVMPDNGPHNNKHEHGNNNTSWGGSGLKRAQQAEICHCNK
ncbi:unnamed protein product [Tuber melanosporum]|uniref:(Perigord truffle) hypothetical protein n=1 Tax=Tuber melanosporum (strain Mel28) TaxID=656061 RepID=D5GFD7_TUBMM|nr:uncharacterized protein GSTUM_00006844001 [Tuber melanosporum]CAZ83230.1 unnamed protein product [Tuber melanosporum]